MIDVNLPLELDDGRPVELVIVRPERVQVRFKGPRDRRLLTRGLNAWWYEINTGVFVGDLNNSYFTLRNRAFDDSDYEDDLV